MIRRPPQSQTNTQSHTQSHTNTTIPRTARPPRARGRARGIDGASAALLAGLGAVVAVAGGARPAFAQGDAPPVVHPIYSRVPDAPQNDLALQRFTTATRRYGLGPIELVEAERDPVPATAETIQRGVALVRKLELPAGQAALDAAATEVDATGGAGLDSAALSDLYLYRAWASSHADYNPDHVPTATARAASYADIARAAILAPGRTLAAQQFPATIVEDWARAVADVQARPQGTLIVHATPDAEVTCDGRAPVRGPATFVGLPQGPHAVHVDEPGWAAWGATVAVDSATVDLAIPIRRALSLGDADAAARARRMGARFALVAEPRPGQGTGLELSLRLIDATGARRDAAIEPLGGDVGGLDAAVMRLDEQARRLDREGRAPAGAPTPTATDPDAAPAPALPPPVLVAPPAPPPALADNPGLWARDHWPLLTAIGVMVATALVLSIAVASDSTRGPAPAARGLSDR